MCLHSHMCTFVSYLVQETSLLKNSDIIKPTCWRVAFRGFITFPRGIVNRECDSPNEVRNSAATFKSKPFGAKPNDYKQLKKHML